MANFDREHFGEFHQGSHQRISLAPLDALDLSHRDAAYFAEFSPRQSGRGSDPLNVRSELAQDVLA
jgi:hypothetical protein